jgi:hypothetical protein
MRWARIGMAPSDPRVKLIKVPGLLMAALSYSGTWSMGRYEENENRLKERHRGALSTIIATDPDLPAGPTPSPHSRPQEETRRRDSYPPYS